MWYCEAFLNGILIASAYEDNKDWFKSGNSQATSFKFTRIY